MCRHDDDDVDCEGCCFNRGWDDATEGESFDNPYKNFWQASEYERGYHEGESRRREEAGRDQ